MGYVLCVAEKHSVATDIAKVLGANKKCNGFYIGNDYIVTWAVGHLVTLAEPDQYGYVPQKSMYENESLRNTAYAELPLFPETFKLVIIDDTKVQFNIIKELMHRNDVDKIIDCGDAGAEGHILQWFIREKAGNKKEVLRFIATSLTPEAISLAMNNLKPVSFYENLIKGEFCKKKADWILGMSLSRVESIKYRTGINVGRVQSPTLYFIYKRFLDVHKFKITNYYGMSAEFTAGFKAYWSVDNNNRFPPDTKDYDNRVLDKQAVTNVINDIKANGVGVVSELTTTRLISERPLLYDITELQRVANRKYGFTASVTLASAQSLYERFKVLSYPRTDSRYITSDLRSYMNDRIRDIGTIDAYKGIAGGMLANGLNLDKRIIDDNKVTDHHALIVTSNINSFNFNLLVPTREETNKGVTPDSLRLVLDLVVSSMLISFSSPYHYDRTSIEVTLNNGFFFTAKGINPISLGWKSIENALKRAEALPADTNDDDVTQLLPSLFKGQSLSVSDVSLVPKKTTPPKLHTEDTLLSAMKSAGSLIDNGNILMGRGIGTQSTRADIIKKLFDMGYIESKAIGKTNYLIPTAKGFSVIQALPQELYSAQLTADWENKLALIAEGKMSDNEFMRDFEVFIREMVDKIKNSEVSVSFKKEKETHGTCPWCGNNVYAFINKNDKGKVVSTRYYCSNNCGYRFDTSDKLFIQRAGRGLTDAEARKLISRGNVILSSSRKYGNGTSENRFILVKREVPSTGKVWCNVSWELACK